ncbi:MAG: superoxide dismutase [Prolixibacteraceae bacterium]|jgi:Fe-Mn family superoxide dismutase|nr:superoxide dismutase [Prolixibacteraceae bacterium]
MSFELPKLNFAPNALEPQISQKTIEFHYGKHHQTYVDKLNNLTPGTEFENSSLEDIIKKAEGGIFNNAAQVWNHTFYFEQFAKNGKKEPSGALESAIEQEFGTFAKFKEKFTTAATTLFGSGWAWLVVNPDGELEIVQTSNAGNPLRDGKKPIMTCDVWEHAYYLDKQNARPKYIEDFWEVLDWEVISERYA